MRVLDFKCACGTIFEEWIKEGEVALCPNCGAECSTVIWLTAPSQAIGFHPYNVFRNKMDDPNTIIRSVVPKTYKGGKK